METGLKWLWFTVTRVIGTRRICKWAGSMAAYSDTTFAYPHVKGYVALTIDDGLCRTGGCSLTTKVGQLLHEHDARATFFICSDYLAGCEQEAATLQRVCQPLDRRPIGSLSQARARCLTRGASRGKECHPCVGPVLGLVVSRAARPTDEIDACHHHRGGYATRLGRCLL